MVGTLGLLEAVRDYWKGLPAAQGETFRFLHVSTDEVYGTLGETGKFTETTPYAPNSPYSASKAASDHLVRAFHHTYGLPVLTTNCSNNYGPYHFPEKLIPLVIAKALAGEPLPVYGDGKQVRDWLFVSDHCEAIRTVLAKGKIGETYNVGGNSEKQNIEVVQAICALLDQRRPREDGQPRSSQITYVTDRPGLLRGHVLCFDVVHMRHGEFQVVGGGDVSVDFCPTHQALDQAQHIKNGLRGKVGGGALAFRRGKFPA